MVERAGTGLRVDDDTDLFDPEQRAKLKWLQRRKRMGKHLSEITINIERGERNWQGRERWHYTLEQYGKVLKRGSGWGYEGAYAAAQKTLKRLQAKGVAR